VSNRTTVREPEGKDFPQAPEGLHQAVCVDAWDVWTEQRPEEFGGGLVDKTRLVWEIDKTDKENRRPYQVSHLYTASLHEKAKLRQHLESWRGRRFTDEERQGFDLENVIGANCQLQIVHRLSRNGKTYSNVQAIVPIGKGMTKMRPSSDFIRRKDRKDRNEPEVEAPSSDDHDDDTVPF